MNKIEIIEYDFENETYRAVLTLQDEKWRISSLMTIAHFDAKGIEHYAHFINQVNSRMQRLNHNQERNLE